MTVTGLGEMLGDEFITLQFSDFLVRLNGY